MPTVERERHTISVPIAAASHVADTFLQAFRELGVDHLQGQVVFEIWSREVYDHVVAALDEGSAKAGAGAG